MKGPAVIRNYFGKVFLKRELKTSIRRPKLSTFANAKNVALLYKGDDEHSFNNVKQYVKYLKEKEGIRHVMALGYFDLKETPGYLKTHVEFDFFTKNDLNWYQRPSAKNVENFTQKDYDILIDLSKNEHLPLKFVLTRSKAKFKVGRYSRDNEPYYDLMIDVPNEVRMQTYIKQINHYLDLISNEKKEVAQ